MEYTPGPWKLDSNSIMAQFEGQEVQIAAMMHSRWSYPDDGKTQRLHEQSKTNAALIAAAPDHALVLAALVSGRAHWEQRESSPRGELCMSGLRHSLEIDEFGCPVLTELARDALLEMEKAA